MKKDVTDALAKAFFDKKKTKKRDDSLLFFVPLALCFIVVIGLCITVISNKRPEKTQVSGQGLMLERSDAPYKLLFNFYGLSSGAETLNIEIPDVDVSGYSRLRFSARIHNADHNVLGPLKIGLVNTRQENSSFYLNDVNQKWKKFIVPLNKFKDIHDVSRLAKLYFTLEKWNCKPLRGELLIDDIEFLK